MDKFPDIRKFSWKSKKSQQWNTVVQRSASGKVRTLTTQLYPLWTIEASYPALTDEESQLLQGFFASLKGEQKPFWWLDPEDNTVTNRPLVYLSATEYQATMQFGTHVEAVEYIDTVTVYVDGAAVDASAYTIDGGVIVFNTAPGGTVTADYRYYWKMMFKGDTLSMERIFANVNKCSFKMVSAR